LKSLGNINMVTAETIPLFTSRKDVGVVAKNGVGGSDCISEGTLKSEAAFNFIEAIFIPFRIAARVVPIAAETNAVFLTLPTLHAGNVAGTRSIARLANRGVSNLVFWNGLADDIVNHVINTETNIALCLELGVVLLTGIALISVLGEDERNKVLRDSSLILGNSSRLGVGLVAGGRDVLVLHEVKEGVVLDVKITVLARGSSERLCHGIVESVLIKSSKVSVETLGVEGADPTVGPAGAEVGAKSRIFKASVGRSGGGSRSGKVHVGGKLLLVHHGTRIAGRHEENKALVHFLGLHGVQYLGEMVIVETFFSGKTNDTRVTVVIVVNENVIIAGGLKSLATASTSRIARENVNKIIQVCISTNVILDDTFINVDVVSAFDVDFIEDLTRERILTSISHIIFKESDDSLIRNTGITSNMISLVNRRLMTIVVPAFTSSN